MPTHEEARARAAAIYDAAADRFDDPANAFWERFGRETVARLALAPGMRVLDACCGSGASALPAAEAVGPEGSVLGIDVAEKLLALAREKAARRGLANVEFRSADLLELAAERERFDAVVCVFGVFFVPDMAAAVRALWSAVRPGGRLAITTWGPRFVEPVSSTFWDAVRAYRPELVPAQIPWERIQTPETLAALLREGGVGSAKIEAVPGTHPLPSFDAWWAAVLGSGMRGAFEALDARGREYVRGHNLETFERTGTRAAEANVVYAVASKP